MNEMNETIAGLYIMLSIVAFAIVTNDAMHGFIDWLVRKRINAKWPMVLATIVMIVFVWGITLCAFITTSLIGGNK